MVTTAEAWDLWREACCDERGGHTWQAERRSGATGLTFTCRCCPVTADVDLAEDQARLPWGEVVPVLTGRCLHCDKKFRWAAWQGMGMVQKYCSVNHQTAARKKRGKVRSRQAEAGPRRRKCIVCRAWFETEDADRWYCSDTCHEFADRHAHVQATRLPRLWQLEQPCPSGKVKHQNRRDAMKAAHLHVRLRYDAFPGWLTAYRCEMCFCWHLTSKPQVRHSKAAPADAL